MKIDMIKQEDRGKGEEYAEFYIDGIRTHYLNALRRTALVEVPVLAIHEVYIHKNTSSLFDDVLANRLGLVPLTVDPSEIDVLGEGRKAGKDLEVSIKDCTARLRLQERGKDGITVITSGEIESVDKETVKPVNSEIPIVKLAENQQIDVEMVAKVGRGKDHAKWTPTETNGYKPLPGFYVRESCTGCTKCVEACPKDVLEMKGGRPLLTERGRYECDLGKVCVRACPENALVLTPAEETFIYKLGTVGHHSLQDLLITSTEILQDKATGFLESLHKEINTKEEQE